MQAATSERVREGDENVERDNWSSKIDYLLSVIGSAVGLGNVWRFPYLAYRNGGGIVMKSKIQGRNKHKDNKCQQLEEIPLKVFTTSFPASGSTLRKYTKNRWVPSGKSAANPAVNRNDENVKRGNWSSKTDSLLSMIGCAVGLGNVWRFPFLAYKNGGGVFLIPYSIMLGLVGIPIFFLESSFGQFASLGPVAVWKSVPMLQGVGVTMVLLIVIANISYACIIGYSLYYLFASFQSPLDTANEHGAVGDENVERGTWSSKTDYLLSMIGNAVGFGNVWRFPYLAYKNGGGALLIPYSVMLALVGIPLFFLECSFGQFASLGPVAVWRAVPMLQGVGIAMMLLITMSNISYNCIVGYSLYYLFASFQSPLPWADCFSWWGADETCSRTPKETLCNLTLTDGYFEIVNITQLQENNGSCPNGSEISNPHQGPSEQYWDKAVLRRSSSMDETGEVIWYLALCLLLAWLIVGAALSKGIKSSGKVVYFTATFPYVVLTILLIRGVTLEGASKGIEFYIGSQSDFSRLADAEVWKDAVTQIFFSISVGWGTLVALLSYNKFHNNCYRDTIIVCVVNCATSVFAGFVIFSILGHMAHIQDKPVSEVAQSGFDLAFIAYPEALAQLPWATLWSILFFFMLITLGLDTLFATVEDTVTKVADDIKLESWDLLAKFNGSLRYGLDSRYNSSPATHWSQLDLWECGNTVTVTVLRNTPGPRSSFITEEKRARLKSNPVKVHFAEEVIVNGQVQGNSLLLMPGILKVYWKMDRPKPFD
ncbi:sodium- and chloride-dependent neutral and basic amino acid transporter B(0+)-like [Hemiscyllium ocellatum]|uniref:sodium- and chloride-dependent neutral and basic amino acid transporter B(0+)-like n=1 Tax=Hemiscyllium ocellatum TaxID=170820 RepID=UPI002965D9A2|nr:sodium- and chloride-dependent neutral and basic amino acid transporter B(0+)-like [Hemiscyllium ocellatum]